MSEVVGTGVPYTYDYINTQTSRHSPSEIHCSDTGLVRYFQRYLLEEAISQIEWTMPKEWASNYFLYTLYCWGYVAIINTDKFGVIPQGCGLMGYDVFYQPTNAIIQNPLLKGIIQPRIGTECALIKLQPDYGGLYDIVSFYADMMALTAQGAALNILQSKNPKIFMTKNKAAAEAYKKMVDQVLSGKPASVLDQQLFNSDGTPAWVDFDQNLSGSYIAGQMLDDLRKWKQAFCTEIGIPNANTDKKERLITGEVNANNTETASKLDLWIDYLQEGIEEAKRIFPGLVLSAKRRYNMEEGSADNERNDINSGAVSVG